MSLKNHPARLAAIAAGEVTFDTGVPCRHGHLSPRYTRPGSRLAPCVECDRQSRSPRAKLAARKNYSAKRSAERQAKVLADNAARDAAHAAMMEANRAAWLSMQATPKSARLKKTRRKIAPHHHVKGIGRV